MYMYIYVYMYMFLYVYMYICVYIYVYIRTVVSRDIEITNNDPARVISKHTLMKPAPSLPALFL